MLKNNYSKINDKVLAIANNYRPNYIILGHNNVLRGEVISKIRNKHGTKFSIWYEDALGSRGQGPNWKSNLNLIEKNNDLIDSYFLTTHPDEINSNIKKVN